MKSIWIVNHYAEVPPYGKYTRHIEFAKRLAKRGHRVKIFTASTIHNTNVNLVKENQKELIESIDGVEVHFIRSRDYYGNTGSRAMNMLDYFFGILRITKDLEAPDIIYASSPHPLNWVAAWRLSKRFNCKFVAETRDLWPETFVGMKKMKASHPVALTLYALERYIYKNADGLIFTFEGGVDYLEEKHISNKRVFYINNGIDLKEFSRLSKECIFRDKDLDNSSKFNVVYTGALGQANQVITVLKLAEKLKESHPRLQFLIFGDGYLKNELETFKGKNGLENVIFKGKVEKKYIPSILSRSDVNIVTGQELPMYKFGVSLNKIPEYLAAGRPILSDLKVGYDIISNTDSGIVVPTGEIDLLAEALIRIYSSDLIWYNNIRKNAREAAKRYDFEYLVDILEGSFEAICPSKRN